MQRILVAIPHFYDPESISTAPTDSTKAGSAEKRSAALTTLISRLHELFAQPYLLAEHSKQVCTEFSPPDRAALDIFLITNGDKHLVNQLGCAPSLYKQMPATGEAPWLGLAAHKLIQQMLGRYDWYCYLEDDTIIEDPLFFEKLRFANAALEKQLGLETLLQPARYETVVDVATHALPAPRKLYLDWECKGMPDFTGPDVGIDMLGRTWTLEPARHPHAGCFFLDQRRAELFARSKYCGEVVEQWGLPGDTTATLAVWRTFRLYKPRSDSLAFLEVRHARPAMLGKLRSVGEGRYTWRKHWPPPA